MRERLDAELLTESGLIEKGVDSFETTYSESFSVVGGGEPLLEKETTAFFLGGYPTLI